MANPAVWIVPCLACLAVSFACGSLMYCQDKDDTCGEGWFAPSFCCLCCLMSLAAAYGLGTRRGSTMM